MVDKRIIQVIQSNVDEQGASRIAASIAASIAGSAQFRVEREVFYPYLHFTAKSIIPTLFAKQEFVTRCLVDGRRGFAATADEFKVSNRSLASSDILEAGLPLAAAENAARRYVSHLLTRNARTITHFNVELEFLGTVYKSFWLLRNGRREFILDSVTGQFHGLSRAA